MNGYGLILNGARLIARASGALHWPDQRLLVVSDLHLGKSRRALRRGGAMLPPYEVRDTLARLQAEIAATAAEAVVCLGDSFDDLGAIADLGAEDRAGLSTLMAGRRWIWVEGNHDRGARSFAREQLGELRLGPLVFRHIATPAATSAQGEISGHYHPKARLSLGGAGLSRPCFLADHARIVMPAFGTYTGGMDCRQPPLCTLMSPNALAVLTGDRVLAIPMPSAKGLPRTA